MELTGPFIKTACFCEQVLHEKDGTLSLIRVIDRITQTVRGSEVSDEMPPLNRNLKIVFMLISGSARGRYELDLKIEEPSGLSSQGPSSSIHFDGSNKGVQLIFEVEYTFTQEGIYWFKAYLEGTLITKLPFQVIYIKQLISS